MLNKETTMNKFYKEELGPSHDKIAKSLIKSKSFKVIPNNTNDFLQNVAIVLQGYATSKEQMLDIYMKYSAMGFTNIVISSYSKFIPDELIRKDFVITNDDILGKYDRVNKINSSGLNYQILTTKNGIKYVVENLKNIDYIIKLRADHFCHNLNLLIEDWIKIFDTIQQPVGHAFEKKIVTPGISGKYKPYWTISDYISFGTISDMNNLWNIPTTQTDKTRAEDYVNNFYLLKHLSGKSELEVESTICNGEITKYSNSPKDYFIFDNRFCEKYLLYSYKPIVALNSPGFINGCQHCNSHIKKGNSIRSGVWKEMHFNFS